MLSLFLRNFKISVLYRIQKINRENKANPKNITNKGINIEECIAGDCVSLILAGWCKVFHQSTENLIIGKLAKPIIAMMEEYFSATKKFFIKFQDKI